MNKYKARQWVRLNGLTVTEAKKLITDAFPYSGKSRVNKGLSQRDAAGILLLGVNLVGRQSGEDYDLRGGSSGHATIASNVIREFGLPERVGN